MSTPKFQLNFLAPSLDPRITFARSGATATRINSSGYIETVAADAPRFNYNPVTLAINGLLIEEQKTNIFFESTNPSGVAWTRSNCTVSSQSTTAPDGSASAYKLIMNNGVDPLGANSNGLYQSKNNPGTGDFTWTLYAKAGEFTAVRIREAITSGAFMTVNLLTGAISFTSGASFFRNARAVDAGNGWYKITWDYVGWTTNNVRYVVRAASTGDGSSGFFVWHQQMEAGTIPTSPIITPTTAAVTRNADVATITGTAFSGLWRSGPGSILVRALPSTVSGTRPLVQVDDNTADNIIALRGNTTNPELYIRAGGSDQATIDAGAISAAAYRLAGAWQAGSAAASLNSGLAVNGAPASIPAVTQMRLGSDGTNYLNGHLQAVEYYDERVSDAGLRMLASTAGRRSMLRPIINRII